MWSEVKVKIIRNVGEVHVSLSHDLSPLVNEPLTSVEAW